MKTRPEIEATQLIPTYFTCMAALLSPSTSAACFRDLLALCSPSAAITCDHLVSADFGDIADIEEIADADEVVYLLFFSCYCG